MNGHGKTAAEWVGALEALTLRNDLSCLTLSFFRDVFPEKGLLKKERAWCPHCFHDWKEKKRPIYEPLLWKMQEVKVCPDHKVRLVSICPSCRCQTAHLAAKARNGHCFRCDEWLGYPPAAKVSRSATWGRMTRATQIGGVLAKMQPGAEPPRQESICRFFDYVINHKAKGSVRGLGRLVNINHTYISDWRNGKYLPTMGALMKVCRIFKISLEQAIGLELLPMEEQDEHGLRSLSNNN